MRVGPRGARWEGSAGYVASARTESNGRFDSGTAVVSVSGELDLATAPALEQTLVGVADDRTDEVIVDLTGCTFLDSQGLRAGPFRIYRSLGAAGDGNGNGAGQG